MQGYDNKSICKIIHVGQLEKPTDIMINQFEIPSAFKCIIASIIYTKDILIQDSLNNIFRIAKIIINTIDNKRKLAVLYYCFNPVLTLSSNNISEFLSSRDSIRELQGNFSIILQYQENNKTLSKIVKHEDVYLGKEHMINTLMECLTSDTVLEILFSID